MSYLRKPNWTGIVLLSVGCLVMLAVPLVKLAKADNEHNTVRLETWPDRGRQRLSIRTPDAAQEADWSTSLRIPPEPRTRLPLHSIRV